MKRLGSLALVSILAVVGCDNNASRLDNSVRLLPGEKPATGAADHSGALADRVARIEAILDKDAEALDFLNKVYAQQKAQQQQQQHDEPAEDAVFAVDIAPDVQAGQVEGSSQALVTIIEAWDFA